MTDYHHRSTQRAIAIMTAWASEPAGSDFSMETMTSLVHEQGQGDDFAGTVDVLFGMVNLCGYLLADAHGRTDVDELTILQEIAKRIA